jgi:chromosome segregation ATPase
MREFFNKLLSAQDGSGSGDGLPYWIFWLLLCVILLLVAFIFLRDKDLRKRLDSFFAGIKKKIVKVRLKARLKRVNQKKIVYYKELGQKAREEGVEIERGEIIAQELSRLDDKKQILEDESSSIETEISNLKSNLEKLQKKYQELIKEQETLEKPYLDKVIESKESIKNKETAISNRQKELTEVTKRLNEIRIKNFEAGNNGYTDESGQSSRIETNNSLEEKLNIEKEKIAETIQKLMKERTEVRQEQKIHQKQVAEYDNEIHKLKEKEKVKTKDFQKEIKEWEKNKNRVLNKIKDVDKQKEPLFESLGMLLNDKRVEHKELVVYYSRLDRAEKHIKETEKQIRDLD